MRKLIWASVCSMLLAAVVGCAGPKMLLLSQYRDGTARVEEMASVIEATVRAERSPVSMTVFNMDLQAHPNDVWHTERSRQAVTRIEIMNPNVVLIVGDDAARYFAQKQIDRNPPMKFIFLGVKGDPKLYGFAGAQNVAGVREKAPLQEAFALMGHCVPTAKGVAVLADKSLEGDAVAEQITSAAELPIRVTTIQRAGTLDEWMAAVADLQQKADILCIASCGQVLRAADSNEVVPQAEVLERTAAVNKLPDFSFSKEAVGAKGVMAAVFVPASAQAEMAARMVLRFMFYSEAFASLGVEECTAKETAVSEQRANQLGVKLPDDVLHPAKPAELAAPKPADDGKAKAAP